MTLAELIYQHSLRLPEHAAREALARLAEVRIPWGSRPIPDRDDLYDDARGG